MKVFQVIAILFTFSAVFSYLNYRYMKLPSTVGVMFISLLFSIILMTLWYFGLGIEKKEMYALMSSINFEKVMLGVLLGLLLFAGALHIEINSLLERKWAITVLATFGVLMSTFIVASLMYYITSLLSLHLKYIHCLLFGALISPTDPIAVLGVLKRVGISKSLETKIAGESLFNDGIGVVIFITLLNIAAGGKDITPTGITILFAKEVIGGIVFGFVTGWIAYRMLKGVDDYKVEVLITIALATGTYSSAYALHISAPLAIVTAGLFIGNRGRRLAMSEKTREHLDNFWELIDDILNTVLFVLIGLEVIIVPLTWKYVSVMVLAVPVVLTGRFISVGIPISIMKTFRTFSKNVVKILTWGGLRGGISVALALSIPRGYERDIILSMTYSVVVFSILVQGTTVGSILKQKLPPERRYE